jgi:hypothetical protein
MKRAIGVGVVACVLAFGAAPGFAQGHGAPHRPPPVRTETVITHDGSVPLHGGWVLDSGHVSSSDRDCALLRSVVLYAHYPDGNLTPLDIVLVTSFRGAWATRANYAGADWLKAKSPRFAYRNRRHGRRHVCLPAAVRWDVP